MADESETNFRLALATSSVVEPGCLDHDHALFLKHPNCIGTHACHPSMDQDPGFSAALNEAKIGAQEGGVPIGASLVSSSGEILGKGHNMRVQRGSATLHVRPPLLSYNMPELCSLIKTG